MKRWFSALSIGVGFVLVFTAYVRTQVPAQMTAQPETAPDSEKLFAKIYPVFAHDRCANCHGKVQHFPGLIHSVTPKSHPGGDVSDFYEEPTVPGDPIVPVVECGKCHNATTQIEAAWRFTAPDQMEWAGKAEDQLCVMQADQVHSMNADAGGSEDTREGSYLHHLTTDPLITQAFDGQAGGAHVAPPDHLPLPPLTRKQFLAGAADWVNAGAPCRTTGHISQVELYKAAYVYPSASGRTNVQEYARREVNILRNPDGTAVGYPSARGSEQITITNPASGCTITARSHTAWDRTGPARLTDDVNVTVTLLEGRYEIHFTLPEETAKETSSSESDSTCGTRKIVNPPESVTTTWSPWDHTIRCPTSIPAQVGHVSCDPLEPRNKGTATGTMTRRVLGETDEAVQPWLIRSPAATNRSDTGLPLPIIVTTTWSLKLNANKR